MSEEKEPAVNLSEVRPDPADTDQKPSDLGNQRGTPETEQDNQGENIITDIELLRSMDDISETGVEIEASASDLITLFEKIESDPPRKNAGTQKQPGTQFNNQAGSRKGNIRKAAPHPGRKKQTTPPVMPKAGQPEPGKMNQPAGRHHNTHGENSSTTIEAKTESLNPTTCHHSKPDSKTSQAGHHRPDSNPTESSISSREADSMRTIQPEGGSFDSESSKSKAIGGDISYLSKEDQQFYESVMVDQAPPGARLNEKTPSDLPEPPTGFSQDVVLNEILLETEEEKQERLAREKASQFFGSSAAHKTGHKDRRRKSRNRKKKQSINQNPANPAVSDDQMGKLPSIDFNPSTPENQLSQAENGPNSLTASTTASRRHFVKVKAKYLEPEASMDLFVDGSNGNNEAIGNPKEGDLAQNQNSAGSVSVSNGLNETEQPDNNSDLQTNGISARRHFRKQREDNKKASDETDQLEGREINLADLDAMVQAENAAAQNGEQMNAASGQSDPADRNAADRTENATAASFANSAQSGNNKRTNKKRRKNRKGKGGKNQSGHNPAASTQTNDKTASNEAAPIDQAESGSTSNSDQDQNAAKNSDVSVITAGSDSSASNQPDGDESAENQNQLKDFQAKFGNLGRKIFEEESIEEAQKKKEALKALPFKERFKLFWKKAFKRPGTYGLIIAAGAIIYTLIRMSQLSLLKLSMVGLFVGLGAAGLLLAAFWFFLTRHKLWHLPAFLLCAAIVAGSISVDNRVQAISDSLREMSEPADTYVQNIGLYVPSVIPVSDLNSLNGETFGLMKDRDETGVNTLLVSLADKGIYVKLKFYNNLQQLYKAVRGQAVRAVILDQGDLRLIQTMAGDQTSNQLSLVYSMPVDTGVSTPISTKNLEQDPFTILVSGSSDSIHESSYRSNLNVLVTINPTTHQVLTTVLPRSLFIYNDCQEALACQPADVPDRLSFVSYHSTEALRETVEHLIESPVDFVVRLNTDKILQLFDIGQTIRFNPYGEYTDLNLSDGNVMTGPQIKQFLGVLNDLSDEDLNQELNQLHVLYTLCRSTNLFDSSTFEETMKVLNESVWTSFDYDQLCQLAKMFFLFPEHMDESWQLVTGTSSILYSPTLTEATYMTQPDPDVLQKARRAIQDVINGGTPVASGFPTRQELTGIPALPAGTVQPFNFINPSETPSVAPQPESESDSSSASQSDSANTDAANAPATTPAVEDNTAPAVDPYAGQYQDVEDPYSDPYADPDEIDDPAIDPYGVDDSDLYE